MTHPGQFEAHQLLQRLFVVGEQNTQALFGWVGDG
jgi:hypothetical protein